MMPCELDGEFRQLDLEIVGVARNARIPVIVEGREGGGEVHLVGHRHSSGAIALIAKAWTRCPGRSPSALFTMRWRATRFIPAKPSHSMVRLKFDSPLPSSPLWPCWLELSWLRVQFAERKRAG